MLDTNPNVVRFGAMAAAVALVLAGCSSSSDRDFSGLVPDAIADAGKITVATSPDLPPATFITGGGEDVEDLTGYEVELIEAAADRLGLDVEWSALAFDDLLGAVAAGDVDAVAGGITATDDRTANVTMVTTATTATQWAGLEDAAITPDNACGATVAVQEGTTFVEDLEARSDACESVGFRPIDISTFETNQEVLETVRDGDADALVADAVAVAWVEDLTSGEDEAESTERAEVIRPLGDPYDEGAAGIAVAKGSELAEALRTALQDMLDASDYDSAMSQWNSEDAAVDSIEILG